MPYADPTPQYFPLNIPNNSVKDVQGYYVKVSDGGVTSLFRKVKGSTTDEVVGEIAKKGTSFKGTRASKEELEYFKNPDNVRKLVNDQAVPVVRRSIGGQAGGGNHKINGILGTSLASVAPPTDSERAAADVESAIDRAQNEGLTNITIKANYRSEYGDYYYPLDLNNNSRNKPDVIKFNMFRTSGSKINAPNFETGTQAITPTGIVNLQGSVTLPIQPGISDNNTVDWSGGTLNAIQSFGAAASMQLIGSSNVTDLASQTGTILGKIAQMLTSNTEMSNDARNALKVYFAQEAVGVQNLLSRTSGAILNPNLELLFNGPSLRPFAFTFKMSPRDEKEATQVRQIIRFFKQGMSVKTSSSNIFLQSPNQFRIKYLTWNGNNYVEHPSINRIKKCALLSCDVDYTPDGTYMTYNDPRRTMTSYQLSLRFSELNPIYEDDYRSGSETTRTRPLADDEIGY